MGPAGRLAEPATATRSVMIRASRPRDPSLVTIVAAGLAATVAQILLLRELLVLFYGNEMSTGLALAGWLIWTAVGSAWAARRAGRGPPGAGTLAGLLVWLGVALPAVVLLIRGARWVYGIPAGELATLGKMVLVCLTAPVPVCPAAGALFGLCWARRRSGAPGGPDTRPLAIYVGEAMGAAAGGVAFFFVLMRCLTALAAATVVGLALAGVAGWVLSRRRVLSLVRLDLLVWLAASVAILVVLIVSGPLERESRRWQWGEPPVAASDTPYHNIAVLRQIDQLTVFTNGLWLFTHPDPATTELAVDLALLQHPRPRRLLFLGGGLAGHVEEALRHPGIERIDYVEQDPELVSLVEGFLDAGVRASLRDDRVRIHQVDAGSFLRGHAGDYDVVFLNVGDPINAQMNRFFTVEHFRRIERHLRPGGILTFALPGGGEMVGPAHGRLLSSTVTTLGSVFDQVAVLPGERARFFAARGGARLSMDPGLLVDRVERRGLDLVHVRQDTLEELMSPFRRDYLESVLAELGEAPVNRQFSPICYFHLLMLWAAHWHPSLERLVARAAEVSPVELFAVVAGIGALLLGFFWLGRPRYRGAVGLGVLVQGASGMVIQVVLILAFQILEGFAYLQLALIIAFFMAGLAVGSWWIGGLGSRWRTRPARAIRWFAASQASVTVFPLLLVACFSPAGGAWLEALPSVVASWTFSAASFVAGLLGGAHFSLAALAAVVAGGSVERTGGTLYAVDLVGAAGGALAASLLLLPLYGVSLTLILLSLVALVCLLIILRRPRVDSSSLLAGTS